MLVEWWPVVIMGWPAIVTSAACAIFALALRKHRLMMLAAAIAVPFSVYVALLNVFAGLIVVASYFGAAHALRKNQVALAIGLVVPFFITITVLAYAVLNQSRPGNGAVRWRSQSQGYIARPQP